MKVRQKKFAANGIILLCDLSNVFSLLPKFCIFHDKVVIMKKLYLPIGLLLLISFLSCKGKTEKESEVTTGKPMEKTASATTSTPNVSGFNPYIMAIVEHPIPSFDLWLPVFNAHDADRKAVGLTVLRVGRIIDDTNSVLIRMRADDIDKAKEFVKALKEDLRNAGRTVEPRSYYFNVLRDDSSDSETKERALVFYKVKDFDAWLKVYDEKGKSTREKHGLIDLGLGRGLDDPNTIYLLYAVSDMRKAKARLASSELRKILRNAGIDGRMNIRYYRVVQ